MLFAIFFVLSVVALAFFLVPWFRMLRVNAGLPRQGVNTLLFRDRLRELESDRDTGRIDPDQFAQLKAELEINFLADAQAEEAALPPVQSIPRWSAIAIAITLPLVSLSVYLLEGQWSQVQSWLEAKRRWEPLIAGSLQGKPVQPDEARELTAGDYIRVLQSILQRTPEHVAGWQDLGRAYMQLGFFDQAENAFSRAVALVPEDPDFLLLVVESRLAQGKGTLDDKGMQFLLDALRLDPANLKARMIKGMVDFSRGDYDNAIAIWQALLQDTPADSEGARILQSSIERAETKRSDAPAPVTVQTTVKPNVALQVKVSVASHVSVPQDGTWSLMVYAKAVNGPPMPVAIEKYPYTQSSLEVTLDDSDAMMPQATLSATSRVKVYVRLSRTGQALPQTGDIMVESNELSLESAMPPVTLEIN